MSSSPVGLSIGDGGPRKPKWKVGKRIGSGACASVHELKTPEGKDSGFVIKIVSLPTKTTKKQKTIPEINARLLHSECQIYRNQFPDYQGHILPKLPPYVGPPITGDTDGFRFFVLEKMRAPLWDVIPALLKLNSPSIDLAPIALQLLTCVEGIHDEHHLLVDVKPENFMLAYSDHNRSVPKKRKKGSKSTEAAEDLAKKVRLLDLGLVVPRTGSDGNHRPDDGISEVVGTPLYSSLNVHANHTPSRRDDIEALGYIVAELIIRLVAEGNGESANYEGDKDDEIPTYLPWSHGKSDDAIGEMKAKEVNNIKSTFYQRFGDTDTAKAMKSLFDLTQSMKYKEKPDYDKIHSIFSSLQVVVEPPKKKKTAPKKTAASRTSPRRPTTASRATRSKRAASGEETSDTDKKPSKKQQKTDVAMEVEIEIIENSDVDEDEVFEDAKEEEEANEEELFEDAKEAEDMEWEPVKENRAKPDSALGVCVRCVEGPHAGENFELKCGETEAITIGKKSRVDKLVAGEAWWPLPSDGDADDSHARLELKASKQLCSVNVSDLNSEGGTFVGAKQVSNGMRAFMNDTITIGNSVFRIMGLPKSKQGAGSSTPKKAKGNKSKATKAKKPLAQKNEKNEAPPHADVLLEVASGPHKGESYALAQGGVETISIGSKKSVAKKGETIVLRGEGIEQLHARFQLVPGKKLMKVSICDLSKTGVLVNNKTIQKKKEHMAFVGDRCTIGDDTVLVLKRGNN